MGREQAKQPQHAGDAAERQQDDAPTHNHAAIRWWAVVRSATEYNQKHPDYVAEFNRLTNGSCSGQSAGVSVKLVRQWQMQHHLTVDGKVGKQTLDAARKEAKQPTGEVSISETEAAQDAAAPQGDVAAEAVDAGVTGGEEKVEEHGPSFEGDTLAVDGAQRVGDDIAGEGHGLAIGAAARLALVPHIVSQLRKHDFKGAIATIKDSVGPSDKVEVVKAVVEKVSGELSEHALVWFERAAIAGAVGDVLLAGWEWSKAGLEAIQEAHEKGDQKARINCYVYAWSDTIMNGGHDMAGAVTEEEREAAWKGVEDGQATLERQPELPFLLKAEYGDENTARYHLEKSLMERAGIKL